MDLSAYHTFMASTIPPVGIMPMANGVQITVDAMGTNTTARTTKLLLLHQIYSCVKLRLIFVFSKLF